MKSAKGKNKGNEKAVEYLPCPLDVEAMPKHIAIIMDGNGRWAVENGMSRSKGHEAGVTTVHNIVRQCNRWNLKALTLYAFSSENWSRPKLEVNALMLLLRTYLKKERNELHEENVRVTAIGDIERLPRLARAEVDKTVELTANNTGLNLVLALSYGARDEIIRAVKSIAEDCRTGEIKVDEINEKLFSERLDTKGIPDPDLLVRTAGEMRISNFLLWQISYSEYYSTPVYWPDFTNKELVKAIEEYARRTRKFGGLVKDKE
jgi:undecaprenyl diphosphate synthase